MNVKTKVKDCFLSAKKDEKKRKKHKGLLIVDRDDRKATEYIQKAKQNLEICELYKEKRLDYKLPEEWFYTIYYCALAILAKFGVESRNQRCTALFIRYAKDKGLIDYDNDFIDRIMVYSDKEHNSDVDEREKARYKPTIRNEKVIQKYNTMMEVCKKCILQCENIVSSDRDFEIPKGP
ncbi:MAG: hypothetical protein ABIH53_03390 [archaeon]